MWVAWSTQHSLWLNPCPWAQSCVSKSHTEPGSSGLRFLLLLENVQFLKGIVTWIWVDLLWKSYLLSVQNKIIYFLSLFTAHSGLPSESRLSPCLRPASYSCQFWRVTQPTRRSTQLEYPLFGCSFILVVVKLLTLKSFLKIILLQNATHVMLWHMTQLPMVTYSSFVALVLITLELSQHWLIWTLTVIKAERLLLPVLFLFHLEKEEKICSPVSGS